MYKDFITKLQDYESSFHNLIQFCSSLDVLQNSCYIVVANNYCKPIINEGEKSYVNAKQLRHPLIEKLNKVSQRIEDDFKDILKFSEKNLKEIWDNSEDEIWEQYLK